MDLQCFPNLIALYNELTILMDKRRALVVVDFTKVFGTVSDIILIDKLKYGLGKCTF